MSVLVLYVVLVVALASTVGARSSNIRAPSVFHQDEVEMHKYAAVLAASEPFKMQCDEQIRSALGGFRCVVYRMRGKPVMNQVLRLRPTDSSIDKALGLYEKRLEHTLRSYSMSPDSFNSISNTMSVRPSVKRKIMLQAYYYKIAADLESNIRPTLPVLSRSGYSSLEIEDFDRSVSSPPATPRRSARSVRSEELNRFAKSIKDIETVRIGVTDRLKVELKVRELPPNMCDSAVQCLLDPCIRKACAGFPESAQVIVKRNGMSDEEFNKLQRRMKRNPLFKLSVMRELRKME